jgi:hypothetical protein
MTARSLRVVVVGATALVALLLPSTAFALNNRSGVASYGSDANPCTIVSPCLTLQAAINATNAGGEVIVLDSHSIGTAVVDKALSIIAAANADARIVLPVDTVGIKIDAGNGDDVTIRGISIQGDPAAITQTAGLLLPAIQALRVRTVSLHDMTIERVPWAVHLLPYLDQPSVYASIVNCQVGWAQYAVYLDNPNGVPAWASIYNLHAQDLSGAAVFSDGTSNTIMCGECNVARVGNPSLTGRGFWSRANGTGTNRMTLTNTRVTGAQTAVFGEASSGGNLESYWYRAFLTRNDRAHGAQFLLGDGSVRFISTGVNTILLSGTETGSIDIVNDY